MVVAVIVFGRTVWMVFPPVFAASSSIWWNTSREPPTRSPWPGVVVTVLVVVGSLLLV